MPGENTLDWTMFATVVRLAEQFGPFLFAILFLLVITRTAHGYYQECNSRKHPAASEQEKKTYRSYFICSMWFGIGLTTLSIAWWVYVHLQGQHIYQVTVLNLQADEVVNAEYYSKRAIRPVDPGAVVMHDLYFVIVQEQPFKIGDTFSFFVFKTPPNAGAPGAPGVVPAEIKVQYSGRPQDRFRLQLNVPEPKFIVADGEAAPGSIFTADDIARAQRHVASLPAPGAVDTP